MQALEESLRILDKKDYPKELSVLPLRDIVVYPGMILPISVGIEKSIQLVNDSMESNKLIALITQKDSQKEEIASEKDLYKFGTLAIIHKIIKTPDDNIRVVVQGLERIKLKKVLTVDPYCKAKIEVPKVEIENNDEVLALMKNLTNLFQKAVNLSNYLPPD